MGVVVEHADTVALGDRGDDQVGEAPGAMLASGGEEAEDVDRAVEVGLDDLRRAISGLS